MSKDEKIERLHTFKKALESHELRKNGEIRSYLNQNVKYVRREILEAGCLKTVAIAPPPAVGGLMINRADPFDFMFDAPYGKSLIPLICDMIDQAIGVIEESGVDEEIDDLSTAAIAVDKIQKGFVFIAMPMSGGKHEYDDVHDAIKAAATNCGLMAERVDEVQSNDRITDRLLESIRKAEYVVADLTDARPNVFYEAGFAYGLNKTPIYVARQGSALEFDLKDYPVIFFKSMRELRLSLEERFRGLARQSR